MLRLAEAVRLGSLVLTPKPYRRWDDDGSGCALAMADKAIGVRVEEEYPWVSTTPALCPHGCTKLKQFLCGDSFSFPINSAAEAIIHIFNEHICEDKTWTIEKLCDWIESIDPTPRESASVQPETEEVCVAS